MATHSSVLAWRIPGLGEPGGLPSMGSQSRTRLKRLSSSSNTPYMPTWISHLPHYGTLPFPTRYTFPMGLQEVCENFVKINVTHVPHIALLKIK